MHIVFMIKLIIKSGDQKPYLYKSKAYKRNDTATIEVDKSKTAQLLKDIQKKGVVEVEGRGRGTKYIIK